MVSLILKIFKRKYKIHSVAKVVMQIFHWKNKIVWGVQRSQLVDVTATGDFSISLIVMYKKYTDFFGYDVCQHFKVSRWKI